MTVVTVARLFCTHVRNIIDFRTTSLGSSCNDRRDSRPLILQSRSKHYWFQNDLPRFELLTRCIAETLRLWNVASVVFPRVVSFNDEFAGTGGVEEPVPIAAGTKFTFWFCKHFPATRLAIGVR